MAATLQAGASQVQPAPSRTDAQSTSLKASTQCKQAPPALPSAAPTSQPRPLTPTRSATHLQQQAVPQLIVRWQQRPRSARLQLAGGPGAVAVVALRPAQQLQPLLPPGQLSLQGMQRAVLSSSVSCVRRAPDMLLGCWRVLHEVGSTGSALCLC